MKTGIDDLRQSLARPDIWLHFSLSDTRARYIRSTLGPWWITLGTALGVIGLAQVWSLVMHTDLASLMPSLAVGLVLWYMIAGILTESANGFTHQAAIIRNYPLPLLLHVLRLVTRHLINFAHNLLIIVLVFLIYGFPAPLNLLWALAGLLILVLNLGWLALLIATLGARFRDLGPSIEALMPVLFFLTPILYKSSDLAAAAAWFDYNPLTRLFVLVKNPLLELPFTLNDYLLMLALAAVGWTLALQLFSRSRQHIVMWL
ncbi:ABC transporter permease (plasmid) [Pseudomonas sp. DTU_2021_1001937_2_SI_NGA_ILE_001]|uniref:ABC transporter permease n=1 Tax=Pseudomonas sp. DTU_2021_1001937_2_SI_NGA_ILE_001 TaxID=3077589 RepID=UPI0028FC2444|nr:ABC transporter permease [Pseudomonas sp. DTU_2021_1001937_2_SI_NGA_ILE_001]WNW14377.1 ABC transporter permease [Pseudomonas sp. DTU_2021_1001937_2_SI_NGA_ILE_001]